VQLQRLFDCCGQLRSVDFLPASEGASGNEQSGNQKGGDPSISHFCLLELHRPTLEARIILAFACELF
jgi:hypothetical protein